MRRRNLRAFVVHSRPLVGFRVVSPTRDAGVVSFEAFVVGAEGRLRLALVATYGADIGQLAALDALSWAWEHWERVAGMVNPVGYLYRVGQSAARRHAVRPIPVEPGRARQVELPAVDPDVMSAVDRLPEQQRVCVLMVHGLGWSIREAAATLDLAPSTVQTHVERALTQLRSMLEDHHDA